MDYQVPTLEDWFSLHLMSVPDFLAMRYLSQHPSSHCKFCNPSSISPGGGFIVVVSGHSIDLWDITGPDPCLFQTLIGHTGYLSYPAFSSSLLLISASEDCTIKFWQVDPSLTSSSVSCPELPSPISIPIRAVSLQARDVLVLSIDSEGAIKIWDILSGLCRESIMTPAKDIHYGDMQVIDNELVISWHMEEDNTTYIWNSQQG